MFAASGKGKLVGFTRVFEEEDEEEQPQLTQRGEKGSSPDADENKYRKETRKLTTWMAVVVLGWLLGLFVLVVMMDRRLPTALTIADLPNHSDSFIEERARHHLRSLTSIGAHRHLTVISPSSHHLNIISPSQVTDKHRSSSNRQLRERGAGGSTVAKVAGRDQGARSTNPQANC